MKIDENTGLPELPEGQYWSVQEHQIPAGSYPYSNTNVLGSPYWSVSVMRKYTRTVQVKQHWWSKASTQTQPFASPVCTDLLKELTKETVLKAATSVLEKIERRKVQKSLLGNYPPNKLV